MIFLCLKARTHGPLHEPQEKTWAKTSDWNLPSFCPALFLARWIKWYGFFQQSLYWIEHWKNFHPTSMAEFKRKNKQQPISGTSSVAEYYIKLSTNCLIQLTENSSSLPLLRLTHQGSKDYRIRCNNSLCHSAILVLQNCHVTPVFCWWSVTAHLSIRVQHISHWTFGCPPPHTLRVASFHLLWACPFQRVSGCSLLQYFVAFEKNSLTLPRQPEWCSG